MSAAVLPTPARPFGADTLACALTLTGTTTPTSAELTVVLNQMYPGNTGPTVTALLAAGRLVPAVSDPSRLRQPPLTSAEVDARLTPAEEPDKTRCVETPAPSESKHRADTESESLESLEKANSRHITGMGLPAPTSTIEKEERPALPLFSFFSGGITTILPCATMTPAQLFAVLTSDRYRAQTEALRAAPMGSLQRAELKRRFDYFTAAGIFTSRQNAGLVKLSGLLVLDFDHVPDLAAARAALLTDAELAPELVLLFTSPSGP